jgi:hypothetical protein
MTAKLPRLCTLELPDDGDEITPLLPTLFGVVEATNEETHHIWERYHDTHDIEFSHHGWGIKVGTFAGAPIWISAIIHKIAGKPCLFWHAISPVVHTSVIDAWLDASIPQAKRPQHHTDACNFINLYHTAELAGGAKPTVTLDQRVARITYEGAPAWWNSLRDTHRHALKTGSLSMLNEAFAAGVRAALS